MHQCYRCRLHISVVEDSIGNRSSATNNSETTQYQANSLNQYTNITDGVTNSPTYDADGNMLSNGDWTYTWNGENRLVSASNGATVVSFNYDYTGRRFSKTVDGSETLFIYDGWNLVQEFSNSTTNNYVWGLDLSQTLQGAGGVGGLLSVTESDGETYFSVADANGNVTGYIDDAGNVKAVYTFDAFGNIIASSGAKVDDFKFRFSTKYLDATGLSYYGRRYYSSELARWQSRDPIGEWGGLNLYSFLFNNSINHVDVRGLFGAGNGAVDRDGNSYPGHDDFSNLTDCPFDYNMEDEDEETQPLPGGDNYGFNLPTLIDLVTLSFNPAGHFETQNQAEGEVVTAMSACDAKAFERAMHRGQDYFVHRKQGYEYDPPFDLGHPAINQETGRSPDDNIEAWNEANEWTIIWLGAWSQNCCLKECGEECEWILKSEGPCKKD